MAMRGYQVYVKHYEGINLLDAPHIYCFSFIDYNKEWCESQKEIYIYKYTCKETKKYIKKLTSIINKITPCGVVKIDKKQYIKFKLLTTYDQSLILLNFIRNLWHNPVPKRVNPDDEYKYINEFFNILMEAEDKEDPLELLTRANKTAILSLEKEAAHYGHSNIARGELLKIRSTEELLKYKGYSTNNFLCGKQY